MIRHFRPSASDRTGSCRAAKIFVRPRRDDVKGDARAINKALGEKYGIDGVFMDVRNLSGGQVADQMIADELAKSDALAAAA